MGKFTVIPQATFDELQLDAGVLLKTLHPAYPKTPTKKKKIYTTTNNIKTN